MFRPDYRPHIVAKILLPLIAGVVNAHDQPAQGATPASQHTEVLISVSTTMEAGTDVAAVDAAAASKSSAEKAPSPLWLVVMPAIPMLGAGLIYTKRQLVGTPIQEARQLPTPETEDANPEEDLGVSSDALKPGDALPPSPMQDS